MQMSRIDFKEPIDASLSKKIKSCIAKTEGVKHVYFNEVDDIVVYSHDPKLQSSQQVFETVQSAFPVQMERYIVSSDMEQRSCPVTGKNSVFLRFGGLLSNVLKWQNIQSTFLCYWFLITKKIIYENPNSCFNYGV